MGVTGLKSRCWQSCVPSGGSGAAVGGRSWYLASAGFQRPPPYSLACVPLQDLRNYRYKKGLVGLNLLNKKTLSTTRHGPSLTIKQK